MKKIDIKGFTIIELLIATAVVSIILLIVTATIVNLGNLYDKGATASNTQDTVRNLADQITSELQVDGDSVQFAQNTTVIDNPWVLCIGDNRYTFVYDTTPIDPGASIQHAMWYDIADPCNPFPPAGAPPIPSLSTTVPSNGGQELLTSDERITSLCLGTNFTPLHTCNSAYLLPPFELSLGIISGTPDLLCDKSITNTSDPAYCNNRQGINSSTISEIENPNGELACKPWEGQQFCSSAFLETVVSSKL